MRVWTRLRRRKIFLVVLTLTGLFILASFLAPYFLPYNPFAVDMTARLQPESSFHWFGTDQLGRDLFSRVLLGSRITLVMAISIVAISAAIGIILGAAAGLARGTWDKVFTTLLDVVLSFPGMIVALGVLGFFGPGLYTVAFALIVTGWAQFARVTRAIVVSECAKSYVQWDCFSGSSRWQTIYHLVLPNTVPHLLVMICQDIGSVILTVAGFSVIGIGVPPPHPEWGSLLLGSKSYLMTASWLLIYPGLAILIAVSLFNWLGDLLRDALDPYDHTGNT